LIENEENEEKTQPEVKVMKQLAELDKIDPGEEEKYDEEEDEEFEEVMPPQKITFVLGAVQGKPPAMNEFFWDSKNSTWSPQHWERRN
jgi:hypothetical protein